MLLPVVSTFPRPVDESRLAISYKRLSQYCFGVYPTHMDSGAHCGFNEYAFWGSVEAGAR